MEVGDKEIRRVVSYCYLGIELRIMVHGIAYIMERKNLIDRTDILVIEVSVQLQGGYC